MKVKPVRLIGAVAIIMVLATVLFSSLLPDPPLLGASRLDHSLIDTQKNPEVELATEVITGRTKPLNNEVQSRKTTHLGEQLSASTEIRPGLAPRPLYDYRRPEKMSDRLKALIEQVNSPIEHLNEVQRQYRVEQILEQLPYHVTSGEVHPQEATLLHMHLLKNELGMDEQQLFLQVEDVTNLYKSISPLKVIEYQ